MKRFMAAIVTLIFALGLFTATAATASAASVKKVANLKAVTTPTTVTLTWSKVAGATGYEVQKYENKQWTTVKTLKKAAKKLKVKKLTPKKNYKFRIRALKGSAKSAYTTIKAKTVTPKVTGLTVEAMGLDSAKLTWTKVAGAKGYDIQQQIGGKWQKVTSVKKTTVTLNELPAAATSTFRVRAYSVAKKKTYNGKFSAKVSVTTAMPSMGKVSVKATTSTSATISWAKVAGVTGYQIQKLVSGKWVDVNTKVGASEFTVNSLAASAKNQLRVRAYQVSGGKNYYSNWSTVDVTTKMGAASGLTYSELTGTSVKLKWNAAAGAQGYYIYNGVTKIHTCTTNSVTLTITPATAYNITVVPYSGSEVGAPTNNIVFTSGPATVTGLTASTVTEHSITLTWAATAGASKYELQYSESGGSWKTVTVNTATYTLTSLKGYTSYSFRVRAINSNNQAGAYSATVTAKTKLGAATNLSYSDLTATSVTLNWTAVNSAAGYYIYNNGTKISEVTTNSAVLTLTPATEYNITVVSYAGTDTGVSTAVLTFTSAPAKVTDVVLSDVTSTSATVSFAAVTGATGYEISYCKSGGEWVTVSVTDPTNVISGLESYTAYSFKVRAINKNGSADQYGEYSDIVSAFTKLGSVIGVTFSEPDENSEITITWPAVNGATGYYVYNNGELMADVDTNSYVFKVESATTYVIVIVAYNDTEQGEASDENSGESSYTSAPAKIEGVTAVTTDVTAEISWTATDGALGYQVYYSADGENWVSEAVAETSATILNLESGTEYTFKVRAMNKNGDVEQYGLFSDEIKARTKIGATSGLAYNNLTSESVTLTWTQVKGAEGYYVYNGEEVVATVNTNTTELSLTPNTIYSIKVAAYFGDYISAASGVITFTSAPAKVEGVASVTTETTAEITWNAVAGAVNYELQYSTDGENWTSVSVAETKYTISDLVPCKAYFVKVRAVSETALYGSFSDTVIATTTIGAVSGLAYSDLTATSANLSWTAIDGADGYYVLNGEETICETTTDTATITLTPATDYSITVVAYLGEVLGAESEVITFTSAPAKVEGVSSSVVDADVTLTWTAVEGATGYEIQYSVDGTNWESIKVVENTHTFTTLESNREYSFRVAARNKNGEDNQYGEFSDIIKATTMVAAARDLTVKDLAATSATVTWTGSNGASYRVYQNDILLADSSETSITLTLETLTEYKIKVVAYLGDYVTKAVEISFVSAPGKTEGLAVTELFATDAEISWTATEGADKYEIQAMKDGGEWANVGYTANTSFVVTGLREDIEYKFRVRAVGVSGGLGEFSGEVTATIEPFFEVGEGLSWAKVKDAAYYEVHRYDAVDYEAWDCIVKNSTETYFEIPELDDGIGAVLYRIVAYNEAGEEIYSDSITVAAEGYTVTQDGYSVSISWPEQEGATGYTISRSTQEKYEDFKYLGSSATSIKYNLAPGLMHIFEIKADYQTIAEFAVITDPIDLADSSDESMNAQLLYLVEAINRSKLDYSHNTTITMKSSSTHCINSLDFAMKAKNSLMQPLVNGMFSSLNLEDYLDVEGSDYDTSGGYVKCNNAIAVEAFFGFMNEGESEENKMHQTEVTEETKTLFFEKGKSYNITDGVLTRLYDVFQPVNEDEILAYLYNGDKASAWKNGFSSVKTTKTETGYTIEAVLKKETVPTYHNGFTTELDAEAFTMEGESTITSSVGDTTLTAVIDDECRLTSYIIESPYDIDAAIKMPPEDMPIVGEVSFEMNMDMSGVTRYEYTVSRTD